MLLGAAKSAPTGARQVVREYVYVYSAVAPEAGKMTSLLLPGANTAMMNRFLEHVSQEFRDYFIVMQVDRAGWHDGSELMIPENIRLIAQPAYSPELNPVEHVWDYLRENYFHNWTAPTLKQVIDVLIDGLEHRATNVVVSGVIRGPVLHDPGRGVLAHQDALLIWINLAHLSVRENWMTLPRMSSFCSQ
jgi:putative transposase